MPRRPYQRQLAPRLRRSASAASRQLHRRCHDETANTIKLSVRKSIASAAPLEALPFASGLCVATLPGFLVLSPLLQARCLVSPELPCIELPAHRLCTRRRHGGL